MSASQSSLRIVAGILALVAVVAFAYGAVRLVGLAGGGGDEAGGGIALIEEESDTFVNPHRTGHSTAQTRPVDDRSAAAAENSDDGEGDNAPDTIGAYQRNTVMDEAPPPRTDGGPQLDSGIHFDLTKTFIYAELNVENLQFPDEDIRGGAPLDSIPALNHPRRIPATESEGMADDSRVVVYAEGDEAVGYPIPILNAHEVVNDTVGDTPIAVTFCPLCDSAMVFDRRIDAVTRSGETVRKALNFGVSGLVANSNVVFYDKTDLALWSQLLMQCISGPNAGVQLDTVPFQMMTLAEFRERYPRGEVVSLRTGYRRNYSMNPYSEYLKNENALMFPVDGYDRRLPLKQLGVGIVDRDADRAVFVSIDAIGESGRTVQTSAGDVVLRANETGVSILKKPDDVDVAQTFYYSWSAFYPDTEVIGAEEVE